MMIQIRSNQDLAFSIQAILQIWKLNHREKHPLIPPQSWLVPLVFIFIFYMQKQQSFML